MKSTKEIMSLLAQKKHTVPALVYKELKDRDKEIELLHKKIDALNKARG